MANTSATYPGTGASSNAVGSVDWSTPQYIQSASSAAISESSTTNAVTYYLKGTNFGFSIPASATVDGIVLQMYKRNLQTTGGREITDSRVRLVLADGSIGTTDKSNATAWPTTAATISYGGSTDKWGETLTGTDVNDADFGFVLSATFGATSGTSRALVYWFQATIYYTETASGPAHLKTWNGIAKANLKTINGISLANIKTISGVD